MKTIHYWNTFGAQYYYNNFRNNNLSGKKKTLNNKIKSRKIWLKK